MSRLPRPSSRHLPGFLAGLTAAPVVGGATAAYAYAAIPSTSTGLITGCLNKDTAVMRVIDYQAGKRCTRKEKQVTWSQKGARRPAGHTGLQGAPGPQEPQGRPAPVASLSRREPLAPPGRREHKA